jgi:hypothetical protein
MKAEKGRYVMKRISGVLRQSRSLLAAGLMVAIGCGGNSRATKQREDAKPAGAPAQSAAGPGIDLNCVPEHLQNPPEPFHYSYHWTGDRHLEQEVDVTPQTLDGTATSNNSGQDMTDKFHAVRSDSDAWRIAVGSLNFGIAGLAGGFALVRNGSATVREGTEQVNGYDTIRYSIDTARGDAAEQVLYKNTLGPGGFEKGTVWVTSQGCPVKISLDDEIHTNDGSVSKDHYEEAMVRK